MHIDHFKEHFQPVTDQRQSTKITYCLFEVLYQTNIYHAGELIDEILSQRDLPRPPLLMIQGRITLRLLLNQVVFDLKIRVCFPRKCKSLSKKQYVH